MNSYLKLKDIGFDPTNYDEDIWFCEQDSISTCAFNDELIKDPVIILSEYTLILCIRMLFKKFKRLL